MLRRIVVLLALVPAFLAGTACGGDDAGEDSMTDASAAAAEQTGADEGEAPASTGECDVIQVLLKLDVTDEQVAAVEEALDGIEGVTHELVESDVETEPSMFLVTADADAAANAVGSELEGDPAVISVVFPEQLC